MATGFERVVHTSKGYAERMTSGSREWPKMDPLPPAVVLGVAVLVL
jgi:hypothetical protein